MASEGRQTPASSTSVKRQALVTTAAFTGVQGLIAVSSFIRIPLVVTALGTKGYGLNTLVGSTVPILLATAGGMRIASRTIVSEQVGGEDPSLLELTKATIRRQGWWVMGWQLLITLPLSWILPFYYWFHAEGIASATQFELSMLCSSLMCGFAVVGSVAWGGLEAYGRTALVNAFGAIVTVLGLVVTVFAAKITKSFLVFAILNIGTTVVPFYLCPLFYRFERRRRSRRVNGQLHAIVRRLSVRGTIQAIPPLATRAVDPFIIGAALGPASVSSYGVAQRLSMASTLIPSALVPVVSSRMARSRGKGSELTLGMVLMIAAGFGAIALVLGAVLVVIGPWLLSVLARGHFSTSRSVFVAFMALGVTFSVQLALSSCVTGPKAMRFSTVADTFCMFVNLSLSLAWVHPFGIVGPVYGSAVGTGLDALLWIGMLLIRRDYIIQVHAPPDISPIEEIGMGAVD